MEENEVVKNEAEKKDAVDFTDFFTKDNSEKGVWHEPNINGKIGIEFRVIGAESNEAAQLFSDYDKNISRIDEIKDPEKKNEETRKALADVSSKIIKDVRGAEGRPLVVGGKPFKFSQPAMYTIMYNSPTLANKIIRFARNDTNFMEKK